MDINKKTIDESKAKLSIWFGLAAGLVYSICLWGIDAIKLMNANAYYPWAKFAMGVLPVVGICILASWLSNRIGNTLVNLLIWLVTGFLICVFACFLSIKGITIFYNLVDPGLAARVHYSFYASLYARTIMTCVVCTVMSAIGGVFFGFLLENANNSSAMAGVLFSILIWCLFFASSASAVNVMVATPLCAPVSAVDRLIEKWYVNEVTPYSKVEARELHLSSLKTIKDLLHQPRKLILADFDTTLVQTSVQLNFDGVWAECTIIADQSSEPPVQHPVYCEIME
jgi:hypothetical protein